MKDYRQIAREIYEWKCDVCGIEEEELSKKYSGFSNVVLQVHHRDCLKSSEEGYHKNNNPENLQVLCCACHRTIHNKFHDFSGESNPRFGVALEAETKEKISTKLTSHYEKEENRDRQRKNSLMQFESQESRDKHSEISKKRFEDPSQRNQISETLKAYYKDKKLKEHPYTEVTRCKWCGKFIPLGRFRKSSCSRSCQANIQFNGVKFNY